MLYSSVLGSWCSLLLFQEVGRCWFHHGGSGKDGDGGGILLSKMPWRILCPDSNGDAETTLLPSNKVLWPLPCFVVARSGHGEGLVMRWDLPLFLLMQMWPILIQRIRSILTMNSKAVDLAASTMFCISHRRLER